MYSKFTSHLSGIVIKGDAGLLHVQRRNEQSSNKTPGFIDQFIKYQDLCAFVLFIRIN